MSAGLTEPIAVRHKADSVVPREPYSLKTSPVRASPHPMEACQECALEGFPLNLSIRQGVWGFPPSCPMS